MDYHEPRAIAQREGPDRRRVTRMPYEAVRAGGDDMMPAFALNPDHSRKEAILARSQAPDSQASGHPEKGGALQPSWDRIRPVKASHVQTGGHKMSHQQHHRHLLRERIGSTRSRLQPFLHQIRSRGVVLNNAGGGEQQQISMECRDSKASRRTEQQSGQHSQQQDKAKNDRENPHAYWASRSAKR